MNNMNEEVVLESLVVMQRILAKLVTDETKVSEDDIENLTTIGYRINQLIEERTSSEESTSIEVEATKYLKNLGIPQKIKGYQYLRFAIVHRFENGKESITYGLYPSVAKEFQTTPKRVERAIRYAIDGIWNKRNLKKQPELFGDIVKKPTNSEFIATIVDDMKLKHL